MLIGLLLDVGGFLAPELVHATKSIRMIHLKLVPSVEIKVVSLAVIVEIQLLVQFAGGKATKLQLQILEALNQLGNSEAVLLNVEDGIPQFTQTEKVLRHCQFFMVTFCGLCDLLAKGPNF